MFGVYCLASGRLSEGLTGSQAIAEIKRLPVVPKPARPADFIQALRQAAEAASPGDRISAVVLSDFTPAVLREFERVREPAAVAELSYEILAATRSVSNAAVVEARAIGVVENKLDVDIMVANCGDVEQHRKLTMMSRDRLPVSSDVIVAPGRRRLVRMQMDLGPVAQGATSACLPVELNLEPGDGLAVDDVYRVAICIPQTATTKMLLVIVRR